MRNIIYTLTSLLALLYSFQLQAQTEDSTKTKNYSASISVAYTNHATYAGRDFSVTETSLCPTFSYSHNLGFYGSLSGNWVDNTYTSSVLGLGYRRDLLSWLSASAGYSRSFIPTDSVQNPLANSFDAGLSVSMKYLNLGATYAYLVGAESGQTLYLSASTGISKDFDGFVNSVSFNPGFSALLGTDNAVFMKLSIKQYKKGVGKTIVRKVPKAANGKKTNTTSTTVSTPVVGGGTTITPIEITENPYGVLSYDLSFPLSVSISKLNLSVTYNLSIPNRLSIYDGKLNNIHYIVFGASYSF